MVHVGPVRVLYLRDEVRLHSAILAGLRSDRGQDARDFSYLGGSPSSYLALRPAIPMALLAEPGGPEGRRFACFSSCGESSRGPLKAGLAFSVRPSESLLAA